MRTLETLYNKSSCAAFFPLRGRLVAICCLTAIWCTGCASSSKTVFLASFKSDSVGSQPSHQQDVGTVSLSPGAGTITVVPTPPGSSGNWVEINHPAKPQPETVMLCNLDQPGPVTGTYAFLGNFYIPTGCEVVTLEFDTGTWQQPGGNVDFFHMDFMPKNNVRLDDSTTTFGVFPRDQVFTVSVELDTAASPPIAHLLLTGGGASGSLDYNLKLGGSDQFGAVKIWMGFQWVGKLDVNELLVTYH